MSQTSKPYAHLVGGEIARFPSIVSMDVDAGTVQLALDFTRDGNAIRLARAFEDISGGVIHQLTERYGGHAIGEHAAFEFAALCSSAAIALRAMKP